MKTQAPHIAVVIPCYRVKRHILDVVAGLPKDVASILVVDDACPEQSGEHVKSNCADARVKVLFHTVNQGVGGAMVTGYRAALESGAEIIIKMDGDGQMDAAEIPRLIDPIIRHEADYTKGNRFHSPSFVSKMPPVRLFGNSVLSFVNKAASGYWNIMDPTNGYTAIHAAALRNVPLEKLDQRYFFESDLLFRLYTIRAVVREVPIGARYGDESSNLSVVNTLLSFPGKYLARLLKRIGYAYFVRDFGVCSLQLVFGFLLSGFGFLFGIYHWRLSIVTDTPATAGTVIVAALPFMLGFQLLLNALLFDAANVPKEPLHLRYL